MRKISQAFNWQFGSESTMYRRTLVALMLIDFVFFVAVLGACAEPAQACTILIATAAAGGFLGLLFGAPRVPRSLVTGDKNQAQLDDSSPEIRLNSNFQAISDWLTMGITVLTLASLGTLAEHGKNLAMSLTLTGAFEEWPANGVLIVLVGAAVLGFAHSFIWANTEMVTGLREQERLNAERAKARAARMDLSALRKQAEFAADQWGWFLGQTLDAINLLPLDQQESAKHLGFEPAVANADPVLTLPAFSDLPSDDGHVRLDIRTLPRYSKNGATYWMVTATLEGITAQIAPGTAVTFYLHPTYGEPATAVATRPFEVQVVADSAGKAQLLFPASEKFWLGAETDLEGLRHRVRCEVLGQ